MTKLIFVKQKNGKFTIYTKNFKILGTIYYNDTIKEDVIKFASNVIITKKKLMEILQKWDLKAV